MQVTKTIVVMGTMDTKGPELAYLAQQVSSAGCHAVLMDVGAHAASDTAADITAAQVAAANGEDIAVIRALPRGEAVEKMVAAASVYLQNMVHSGKAHGIIGVGQQIAQPYHSQRQ